MASEPIADLAAEPVIAPSLLHFAAAAPSEVSTIVAGNFDGADASPEALDRLLAEEPCAWKRSGDGLDMRGRNLAGASLRSANLSAADLRDADLSDVRASGANLHHAQLEGTRLSRIDLVGADLRGVSAGEAVFDAALLEDARLEGAQLRFANFTEAILEGADLTDADLWGANFSKAALDRAVFRKARLDESVLVEAEMTGADLSGATLRRANLGRAHLENANLRDSNLEGADLSGADLTGASLPNLSLSGCDLRGVSFAGAWLERTRMRASQLGGTVGEERTGNLAGAIDSYVVLERNFLSLGLSEDARWAYLRKRRMGRQLHGVQARAHYDLRAWTAAALSGLLWLSDTLAEWLCDYGESLGRVARAFGCIWIGFALLYWVTGSLHLREGFSSTHLAGPVNYLLFSLDSMTTVGTSEVPLRPRAELGILLSSLQTVVGTVLLGLFGFVLGARIRN